MWDIPVRLFHWTLVVLITASYFTARAGGDYWMKFHFWSGYAILALLLFRIAWGFVGSTTARFSHFVKGPSAALHHLAELAGADRPRDVGHNPLGGGMVMVLLFGVLAQVVAGLFRPTPIPAWSPGRRALVADGGSTAERHPSFLGSTCSWSSPGCTCWPRWSTSSGSGRI